MKSQAENIKVGNHCTISQKTHQGMAMSYEERKTNIKSFFKSSLYTKTKVKCIVLYTGMENRQWSAYIILSMSG